MDEMGDEKYTILTDGTVERYYTASDRERLGIKPKPMKEVELPCLICGKDQRNCGHTKQDIHKYFYNKAKEVKKMSEPGQQENITLALDIGFEETSKPGLYVMEDEYDGRPVNAFIDFRETGRNPNPIRGVRYASFADGDGFVPRTDVDKVSCLKAYKHMRDNPHEKVKQEPVRVAQTEDKTPQKPKVEMVSEQEVQTLQIVQTAKQNSGMVVPAVTPEEFKDNWDLYRRLRDSMQEKDDVVEISGKPYLKKSFWRKVSTAFNLTDEIIEEVKEEIPGGFMWRMKVRAIAPNGRSTIGVGVCDSKERKYSHPEHDVYATCHTRAKNRAISDLVGGGEVSFEEVME